MLVQRLIELPFTERVGVLEFLRRDLGGSFAAETEYDRIARGRADAMAALKQVADYLDLGPTDRLTGEAFNRTAATLGLAWTRDTVAELFDGSWRRVEATRRGGQPPETAAQRRVRRHAGGRRTGYEDPIVGLKLFLADDLRAGEERNDYDAFVERYHDRLSPDARPLMKAAGLRNTLGIPWSLQLEVARGQLSLEDARSRQRGARRGISSALAGAGLIGMEEVAHVLGMRVPNADHESRRHGFPAPAAMVGKNRLWRRADIRAYRDVPAPPPAGGELTPLVMDRDELRERLGIKDPKRLARLVAEQRWSEVPPPAGRVGNALYWDRTVVEEWEITVAARTTTSARDAVARGAST